MRINLPGQTWHWKDARAWAGYHLRGWVELLLVIAGADYARGEAYAGVQWRRLYVAYQYKGPLRTTWRRWKRIRSNASGWSLWASCFFIRWDRATSAPSQWRREWMHYRRLPRQERKDTDHA